MASEFSNKVVLITGSSSGIGAAAAIEFARLGVRVVITGRSVDKLKAIEAKCNEAATATATGKKSVLSVPADVTQDEDLRRLIEATVNEFGSLDILVNNAGAGAMESSILSPKVVESYDFVMNTNLRSAFVLTHEAMPHLVKTKGNIVNVSSICGMRPFANCSMYCMSKAAMDMFTKCLALEVGPQGVRVNSVNPGPVKTDFFDAMGLSGDVQNYLFDTMPQKWPLRRVGEPEDIVNLITFLASEKAVNMTGSCIVSDGGAMWTGMDG